MTIGITDIIRILETMAPPSLAEDWDNVGLQIGGPDQGVKSVWVALDPSPDVIDAACRAGVDLLITHHPLIFKPLMRIDGGTPLGASIERAITNRLAVYAMHTNLDAVAAGLNDVLARRLGLSRLKPMIGSRGELLSKGHGIGRVGALPHPMRLTDFATRVKHLLQTGTIRLVGDPLLRVKRVALSTGSGGSLLPHFLSSGADVFLTGDLRYHDARAVEAAGRAAIDIGHFHSEHLMTEDVANRLRRALRGRRTSVHVDACRIERDPFSFL